MTVCSSPHFFDCIEGASFLERMFYIPGISEKFGCRKFSVIRKRTNGEILIKESRKAHQHSLKSVILTIIQIVSCLILFPLLIGKAIFRAGHTFKIITDKSSTDALKGESLVRLSKEEAQKQIDNAWEAYLKEIEDQPYEMNHGLIISQPDERSSSNITPDQLLGNIIKPFKDDPKVHFISSKYYLDAKYEETNRITSEAGLCNLISHLRAAFAVGKEIVVGRYGNGGHGIMVAFQADGKFRIIDSMFSSSISIENLTSRLNQECILRKDGNVIDFEGDYVNTRVQKNGNECMRFATLYAYQIAKKRDLDAYQEVNGAFAEGKLKVFEDYQKMDGSKRLESASAIPRNMYKPFMQSWAFRTCGHTVNRWEEIKINEIIESHLIKNTHIEIYEIQKDRYPVTYSWGDSGRSFSDGSIKMYIEKDKTRIKAISTECPPDRTLGSYAPTDNSQTVILYHPTLKLPISFHLRKDEILVLRYKDSKDKWRDNKICIRD